jgi:hypothetical protein
MKEDIQISGACWINNVWGNGTYIKHELPNESSQLTYSRVGDRRGVVEKRCEVEVWRSE